MSLSSRKASIVGVGESIYTKRGKQGHIGELGLAVAAITAAAEDAGLSLGDIDGLVSYPEEHTDPGMLQLALGMPTLGFAAQAWCRGGGGSCASVAVAVAAVENGLAETVAVFRSICQVDGARYGQYRGGIPHENFNLPFGALNPAAHVALVLQRHMYEHRTAVEDLGAIATTFRQHSHRNPRALMRDVPMTLDDYLASRRIATPFKLLDCCLESDGACAVIVTTAERARDLPRPPVAVLAAAQGSGPSWGGPMGFHNMPRDRYATGNGAALARTLFQRAGLSPGDIDVAQFYDAFTGYVVLALEDFGFCAPGEAGAFASSGALALGGRLPANTAGGMLSEAYIHGFNLVVEGVRQMRGDSTSQVLGATTCFVNGAPGEAPTSALILGSSR